ncbi:MAG: indolepyruvate ferredoxin oxidoreductase, alpha subunit, partial [Chloroflexota bacterium]|nr:indolepyruvate ferredoxin oxidoreductase, alpha subunit [Chloroflexota bacterium]
MKRMLLGNDAIALGAFMAGVTVATGYPGTPSTEILERFAEYPGVYAEWSPNEKVAMEVGMGAAMAGARTMVTMKHVGLNVAADPFFAVAYTGTEAGLVVISADDPGMHSSQGEQDNRNYAKFAKVPLLEPSDSQECADMMRLGLEISEQFDTPVLLRTTTRVSHAQSLVEVAAEQIQRGSVRRPATAEGGSVGRPATAEGRPATAELLAFKRDPAKYVMLPANARQRRLVMEERLAKLQDYVETTPLNFIRWGDRSLGIVTSSIAYVYAREVFPNASFLK